MKYYSIKGLIIDIEFHAEVSSARSHSELAFLFYLRIAPSAGGRRGSKGENRGKKGWPRLKKRDLADDPFRLPTVRRRRFLGNCIDCLRATLYGQPLRATKGAPVSLMSPLVRGDPLCCFTTDRKIKIPNRMRV